MSARFAMGVVVARWALAAAMRAAFVRRWRGGRGVAFSDGVVAQGSRWVLPRLADTLADPTIDARAVARCHLLFICFRE